MSSLSVSIKIIFLLIWQYVPSYPAGQVHVKFVALVELYWQVAWFKHGLFKHGSVTSSLNFLKMI